MASRRLWLCHMLLFYFSLVDYGVSGSTVSSLDAGQGNLAEQKEGNVADSGRYVHRMGRSLLQTVGRPNVTDILLQFKAGVRDPQNVLASWDTSKASEYCSSWAGVGCTYGGEINMLSLSGTNLSGVISSSLGGLQSLSSLNLSHNYFIGIIPASISNCSSLAVLDLSFNGIGGAIPPELGALSNLRELHLNNNNLTGSIPPSLTNLSNLKMIDLGHNSLNESLLIDWGKLNGLLFLGLSWNKFSGKVPADALSNCASLQQLDLSFNILNGSLNESIGKLLQLQSLNLSCNRLTGPIPASLGNLVNLQTLDMSDNWFSAIPGEIVKLQGLTYLDLGRNNLSGSIPMEIGVLRSLTYLDLGKNSLTGSVPIGIGDLQGLTYLNLSSNRLSDFIPVEIGGLQTLTYLDLSLNKLNGSIPKSLSNCTRIRVLNLSHNQLTDEIFEGIGNLTSLENLFLSRNNLSGSIPKTLINCTSLTSVRIAYNQLSGVIPSTLGDALVNLSYLDLSHNHLTGGIPSSLGNLEGLWRLALYDNELNGPIPDKLGNCVELNFLELANNRLNDTIPTELSNCVKLTNMDLSGNSLTGVVPREFRNLKSIVSLDLSNNKLSGMVLFAFTLATTLVDLNLAYNNFSGVLLPGDYDLEFRSLSHLQLGLNMSNNQLSGPIPDEIGQITRVSKLDLSFNYLSGTIPTALGNCVELMVLDLSHNRLDGQIPVSLTYLNLLIVLNLADNDLSGQIPYENNFRYFGAVSFEGNAGLCGPPLNLTVCPTPSRSSCSGFCHWRWLLVLPSLAAVSAVLFVFGACWVFCKRRKGRKHGVVSRQVVPIATYFSTDSKDLTVGDIIAATNGFSDTNIVGMGTKSTVYAGVLPAGAIVAVKRLELGPDDKSTSQLLHELQRLSQLDHPNVLKLHALFSTGDLKVLVMEHMPNGSLRKHLHDAERCRLSWVQRLDIAIGVSEALVYMHHSASKPILHLDLKPSNILLDAEFAPKVADYGISRFLNHETHPNATISSNLLGTIGYIPPEYGSSTATSTKGDIYNFGVVLMELFTGKQPTDDTFGLEMSLCSWVVDSFPDRIGDILDPCLLNELADDDQEFGIHLMVRLSMACTRKSPRDRPTMIGVRDMLLEIKSFLPAQPKSIVINSP